MNQYNYKPTEEQVEQQKKRIHVDFSVFDRDDPEAFEKLYPSRSPDSVEIGVRALYLVDTEAPEAA